MAQDWRDSIGKTGGQPAPEQLRDRAAPVQKGQGGALVAVILFLLAAGAGGFAWWKMHEQTVTDASPPSEAVEVAAPLPIAAPGRPIDVAAIQRGIDLLERKADEHRSAAKAWQAKIDLGNTQRFQHADGQLTYMEMQQHDYTSAIARKDTPAKIRAEQNIATFRDKVGEYEGRKAHELDVLKSLELRLADEYSRLP